MSEEGDQVVGIIVNLPQAPKKVEFPAAPSETISDLKQTIAVLPATHHHTCFDLTLNGNILPEESLIEELTQNGKLSLSLIEKAYSEKSAREHVVKVREIAGFKHNNSEFTAQSGLSKFDSLNLQKVTEPPVQEKESKFIEIDNDLKTQIGSCVNQLFKKAGENQEAEGSVKAFKPALKNLSISPWSPPSAERKSYGDIFYLVLQTLEGETYHVTSHVTGFSVNKSSSTRFDASFKEIKNHSLLGLVSEVSPLFNKQLVINNAPVEEPTTIAEASNCFLQPTWKVRGGSKETSDLGRSQENFLLGGSDAADLFRDWNEEYQGIRELPKDTLQDRIIRERLLIKTGFEFTQAAVQGAMAIVRGDISPMNPSEPSEFHFFLRNGIFYSMGVDASSQFSKSSGNDAARAAASRDLEGVKFLNRLDAPGVYHLCTTIVDFCGQRIICQTPVPGIFNQPVEESEAVSKVCYGVSEEGEAIASNDEFVERFSVIGEALHLKPHTAYSNNGEQSGHFVTSKETKGMKGTDGRAYVIDLYRTTPLDIEFIESAGDSYPHKEVTVRHEAVEDWWRRQVLGSEEKVEVNPLKFSINPDCFSPSDRSDKENETNVRQVSQFISQTLVPELVSEIASSSLMAPIDGFQLTNMMHKKGISMRYLGKVIACASEKRKELERTHSDAIDKICKENETLLEENRSSSPDGEEESESQSNASFVPEIASLNALEKVAISEVIIRSIKHYLRILTAKLPPAIVRFVVSHIHNCLFGEIHAETSACILDPALKAVYPNLDLSFVDLTPEQVFKEVQKQGIKRFQYAFANLDIVPKMVFIRQVALKFGIQWKDKNYFPSKEELEAMAQQAKEKLKKSKNKKKTQTIEKAVPASTFSPQDVVCIYGVVKDSIFRSTIVDQIWEAGRARLSGDDHEEGLILLQEAVQVYEQVYGVVHPEVAKVYGVLAQTLHDCDRFQDACVLARKSIAISERVFGADSYEVILSLINGAFFENANGSYADSMKLYERALSDWSLVYGGFHPGCLTTLTNISVTLQTVQMFKQSVQLLSKASDVSLEINGAQSQITAMINFQLAQSLTLSQNIPEALKVMKQAFEVFKATVGINDMTTKECHKWVHHLTRYITMSAKQQKKLRETETTRKPVSQPMKVAKSRVEPTEIGNQSIDEIMEYIEGKSKKGKKSKK